MHPGSLADIALDWLASAFHPAAASTTPRQPAPTTSFQSYADGAIQFQKHGVRDPKFLRTTNELDMDDMEIRRANMYVAEGEEADQAIEISTSSAKVYDHERRRVTEGMPIQGGMPFKCHKLSTLKPVYGMTKES